MSSTPHLNKRQVKTSLAILLTLAAGGAMLLGYFWKQNILDSALGMIAIQGEEWAIPILLQAGADANAVDSDATPVLTYASYSGNVAAVEQLLTAGARVNAKSKKGTTALMAAAVEGHRDVIKSLVAAGADVLATDEAGSSAVNFALWEKQTEAVKTLISAGSPVNSRTPSFKATLLNDAVQFDNPILLKYLLVNGANAELADAFHWSPLRKAAFTGKEEMVTVLLANGALVDGADKDGWTPLLWASTAGHLGIVKILIEARANGNVQSALGWTPLMKASELGHTAVAEYLIAAGVDVNTNPPNRITALELAKLKKRDTITAILRKAGAIETSP